MKKILAVFLTFSASIAFGTTLNPVQLLNPTGSSSGQAIVSTGASSAPAWGGIGVNGIAAIAANTVLANATASSASPTAFAMPSCSTSASALNWTTSSGFTCNTSVNAATLGGATFAAPGPVGSTTASTGAFTTLSASSTVSGTGFSIYLASPPAIGGTVAAPGSFTTLSASSTVSGAGFSTYLASPPAIGATTPGAGKFTTLQATSTITPSSTAGIIGTTTNDNANAGSVGEYVTSTAGPTSLSSGTNANITSISLTAGDWDVWGAFNYAAAATTTTSSLQAGISSTSAVMPANPLSFFSSGTFPTNTTQQHPVPQQRFSLSATTTVYFVMVAGFASSTATGQAFIAARRVR